MPLFDRIIAANEALTNTRMPHVEAVIDFSNTGRRGGGWFSISVSQLRQTLMDILAHPNDFLPYYDEGPWRNSFRNYLTNDVAKTMGSVQTLPFFELIAKVIHFANSEEDREERTICLDPDAINNAIVQIDQHFGALQHVPDHEAPDEAERLEGGYNLILYGAPGTGKSYRIDGMAPTESMVRTVFHPDTQNSDFFGSLKPRTYGDRVRYEFAPGPFMVAMKKAILDAGHEYFLVIEELNRASAASVFGELFQLLDREENGAGTYDVDFPNPESFEWMRSENGPQVLKLRIPSNLTILATMNSSDQGVYPLDTAFRRRWIQEYLPLEGDVAPEGQVLYVDATNARRTVQWRDFVQQLNRWLTERVNVAEDRLLGQWFVKPSELGHSVPPKIMLYLWDDLLRHHGRDIVFARNFRTYGQLNRAVVEGLPVFSEAFLNELDAVSMPAAIGEDGALDQ